jgi:hypothetical protein
MTRHRITGNPFYLLAIFFGMAFTLTACGFGVLMVKSMHPGGLPAAGQSGYALMDLLDRHGMAILVGELLALAASTVGAIRLDHVRDRRDFFARQDAADAFNPHDRLPSPMPAYRTAVRTDPHADSHTDPHTRAKP